MFDLSIVILMVCATLFAGSVIVLLRSKGRAPRRSLASQVKLLQNVSFLKTMSTAQLERIASIVRELYVPPGIYIVREHRVGEALYFILNGTIDILKRGTHDETLVQTVGPNELVGEMALLSGGRRVASAKSTSHCHLLQIDRDDLLALIESHPEIATAVWEACEVHAIDLCSADHPPIRALAAEARRQWIERRHSEQMGAMTERTMDRHGYLAVVTGAVTVNGRTLRAPDLVRFAPHDSIHAMQASRICWLSLPLEEQRAA